MVELVIVLALLGGLLFGIVHLAKVQKELSVQSQINEDLIQVSSRILSVITIPKNCNANFYGKPTGISLSANGNLGGSGSGSEGLYICNQVNCIPGINTILFPAQNSSWDQIKTRISSRVRIISVKYSVSSTTLSAVSNLKLDVVLEMKNMKGIKTIIKNFNTAVVVNGSTIEGCPLNPGSSKVFI